MQKVNQPEKQATSLGATGSDSKITGKSLAPPPFQLMASAGAPPPPSPVRQPGSGQNGNQAIQRKEISGGFDFQNATNEERANHLMGFVFTNVRYVQEKLKSIQSNYGFTSSDSDEVAHLLVNKLKNSGEIALIGEDLKAKSLQVFRTELLKEAVWKAVIEKQMEDEYMYSSVNGKPNEAFVNKITRSDQSVKSDKEVFAQKRKKATEDLANVNQLFSNFENYTALKSKEVTEDGQTVKKNALIDRLKKTVYTDAADFTSAGVGTWSEGCQVIGSSKDFYDFWHNTTQFAQDTSQTHWYYTIVNMDTLKTTTNTGSIKK